MLGIVLIPLKSLLGDVPGTNKQTNNQNTQTPVRWRRERETTMRRSQHHLVRVCCTECGLESARKHATLTGCGHPGGQARLPRDPSLIPPALFANWALSPPMRVASWGLAGGHARDQTQHRLQPPHPPHNLGGPGATGRALFERPPGPTPTPSRLIRSTAAFRVTTAASKTPNSPPRGRARRQAGRLQTLVPRLW